MVTPKISVIVAVYNVSTYLRQSMDCLMNQTMKDMEFICVDDCSTDESLSILREYEAKDKRFKIITSEVNGGAAIARNKGLDTATGEYLGFIDPDDTIDLNYYEELYKKAKETDADITKCQRITIDEQRIKVSSLNKYIAKNGLYFFTYEWTTAIYKSSIVFDNNIRFPDKIRKGQDTVFLYKILLKSNTIELIDNVNYYYHKRQNSLNAKKLPIKSIISTLTAIGITCDDINGSGLFESAPKQYSMLYQGKFNVILKNFLFKNKTFQSRFLCAQCLINNCHKYKDVDGLKNIISPKWLLPYIKNNRKRLLAFTFMLYQTKQELYKYKPLEKIFSIKNIGEERKVITIIGVKIKLKK